MILALWITGAILAPTILIGGSILAHFYFKKTKAESTHSSFESSKNINRFYKPIVIYLIIFVLFLLALLSILCITEAFVVGLS